MKKVVSLFLSVVMLLSVFSGFTITAHAENGEDVYIEFSPNSDGRTAVITGLGGEDAYSVQYLILSDTVTDKDTGKEYIVTSIDDYAFYGNVCINEIVIPDTVTSIGEYAFFGCNNVVSVDLGNGVQSIGESAFGCKSLLTLHMPTSLKTIGESAFYLCRNLGAIFYKGNESQLNKISVGANNDALAEAVVYLNASFCAEEDHEWYWFNVNGNIFIMCGECGLLDYVLPFRDLNNCEKYADYILYTSVLNSFLKGTNPPYNYIFSPERSIDRAMMVTILYRMAGEPYADGGNPYKTSPFTDITNTSVYYYDAACWALANGVTTETTFKPFNNVTREQTATFLYRYAQDIDMLGDDDYKNVDLSIYHDASSISHFAVDAMKWANYNGMITGTEQGYANPQGATKRIHATKILYGFGYTCEIGNLW